MKRALITGGNSGIGFEAAKLFKERGYDVTITGRDKARLTTAAEAIGVSYRVADMGSLEALQSLAEDFNDKALDALVLNAGVASFGEVQAVTELDFTETIDINTKGPFFLCQYLLPALKSANGSVSIVSSAVVENGLKMASVYAMSKGAMDALVRSLAIELAPDVRVNAVSPGAVDTPILEKYGLSPDALAKRKQAFEQTIPLKRYGLPSEIAQVILAQIEATYVTGAVWDVGGGVHAV